MVAVADARPFPEVLLLVLVLVRVLLQQLRSVLLVEVLLVLLLGLAGVDDQPDEFGRGSGLEPGEEGEADDRPQLVGGGQLAHSIDQLGVADDVGQPGLVDLRGVQPVYFAHLQSFVLNEAEDELRVIGVGVAP
jgi:hypothetical protein